MTLRCENLLTTLLVSGSAALAWAITAGGDLGGLPEASIDRARSGATHRSAVRPDSVASRDAASATGGGAIPGGAAVSLVAGGDGAVFAEIMTAMPAAGQGHKSTEPTTAGASVQALGAGHCRWRATDTDARASS
jgi:hypothetical protein